MSEWSDEAVRVAYAKIVQGGGYSNYGVVRVALEAADAVREREAGEKADAFDARAAIIDVQADIIKMIDIFGGRLNATDAAFSALPARVAVMDRRLSALEAARPVETSGYYEEVRATQELPSKPATERRCGTCRWQFFAPRSMCKWLPEKISDHVVIQGGWVREADGTDCPTWEARNV